MFVQYIKPRINKLLERKFLLELFTFMPDRHIKNDADLQDGEIVFLEPNMNTSTARYGYYENGKIIEIPVTKHTNGAPFSVHDTISISSKDILNYKGSGHITTLIGRFITNYFLLVDTIGDLIPYVNTVWNTGSIEDQFARLILDKKVTTKQYRKYIDNGYFLGHFGELCVPTITSKSLTTDPAVLKRLDELLKQHADELNDPKVVAKIEQELIAMDKEWIKGDPSEGFYGADPKKAYGIHRKKMFIMVGGIDDFAKDTNTVVLKHSLSKGWDKESFAAISNEIRKGSFSRGNETQEGGAQTKVIFRAFQDLMILKDDCGTTRGVTVVFVDNIKPEMFLGRIVITHGKQVEITQDNYHEFVGKKVLMRSPMTCEVKNGLCYKCCGMNFKRLGIVSPGVQAIEISSKFMTQKLKSMHGTVISTEHIDPFEFFMN